MHRVCLAPRSDTFCHTCVRFGDQATRSGPREIMRLLAGTRRATIRKPMAIDSTAQEATDLAAILPWYASPRRPGTGKALERVRQILPEIAEAECSGGWLPKLSRRGGAILSKQPVAEAFARANERQHGYGGDRAGGAGPLGGGGGGPGG